MPLKRWLSKQPKEQMHLNLFQLYQRFVDSYNLKNRYISLVGNVSLNYSKKKKHFMGPFYGWGSTFSRLQSHCEETVYFLPLSPQEKPGIHLIDLRRMEDWVDLGATQWFSTWGPWIGNPAPKLLLYGIMHLLRKIFGKFCVRFKWMAPIQKLNLLTDLMPLVSL